MASTNCVEPTEEQVPIQKSKTGLVELPPKYNVREYQSRQNLHGFQKETLTSRNRSKTRDDSYRGEAPMSLSPKSVKSGGSNPRRKAADTKTYDRNVEWSRERQRKV